MKKAIAMRCTQEDWDSIKDRIPEEMINDTEFNLKLYPYLTNNYNAEYRRGIGTYDSDFFSSALTIHETFNAKIFLEACGIEVEQKFEITKEQILRIAKKCTSHEYAMKEAFPDAFKKELEVGKWYKWKDSLFCYNGKKDQDGYACGYGFVYGNFTENDENDGWGTKSEDDLIEATPQEVETAVINEWIKRGGKDNIYIKSTSSVIGYISSGVMVYSFGENKLYYGGYDIFDDGVFAEPIETITSQEAEKLLNKKIV